MPVVTKIISTMKVSPISIKRHEIAGTMYSEAEKDVDINADSLPPLPKRTPKYWHVNITHLEDPNGVNFKLKRSVNNKSLEA